jgi:hypothetical protein
MILQTIHCSVKGCLHTLTEKHQNTGFKGWGHVIGIMDDETLEDRAHLCPDHLSIVKSILNGEVKWHG